MLTTRAARRCTIAVAVVVPAATGGGFALLAMSGRLAAGAVTPGELALTLGLMGSLILWHRPSNRIGLVMAATSVLEMHLVMRQLFRQECLANEFLFTRLQLLDGIIVEMADLAPLGRIGGEELLQCALALLAPFHEQVIDHACRQPALENEEQPACLLL
jgi:hypothetical protein